MKEPITVIVADDHQLFRNGIKSILSISKHIHVIAEARNGQELIPLVQRYAPRVVLLDVRMPQMGGFEALDIITSFYPTSKVILLSSCKEDNYVVYGIERGAAAYLHKDTSDEEILLAIETVAEGKVFFDDRTNKALQNRLTRGKNDVTTPGSQVILSDGELNLLRHLCSELTSEEIATKMFKSKRTIEHMRADLLQKTRCRNLAGLAIFAVKNGLVEIEPLSQ